MNVFVLSTGRCGSTTFARACRHATNYTAAHESRRGLIGPPRIDYPDNHIESDNRLSWLLGRLDERYGRDAFYVHLTRDRRAVAESYNRRWDFRESIMRAYTAGILIRPDGGTAECLDYCDTVNANIRLFLSNKPRRMNFQMEKASRDFPEFWRRIGAQGDLPAAMAEWKVRYNPSRP